MGSFQDTAALQDLVCPNAPSQVTRQPTRDGTGSTAVLRDRDGTAALAVLEATWIMLLIVGYKRSEVNGLGWKEEQNMLVLNILPAGATMQVSSHGAQFLAWKSRQTSQDTLKAVIPTLCYSFFSTWCSTHGAYASSPPTHEGGAAGHPLLPTHPYLTTPIFFLV